MSQDAPANTPAAAKPRRRTTMEVLRALRQPKVASMAALGFSSGTPFLLIGATATYWLRDYGVPLVAIGFISWVGLTYSLKFIWGGLFDRADAPGLGRLGRRRSWMLLMQIVVAAGLAGMALTGPGGAFGAVKAASFAAPAGAWLGISPNLLAVSLFALLTAFGAAGQDVVIDAWRIEIADDAEELGLLTGAYQLGFRVAIVATDAVILWMAQGIGWPLSYGAFAASMLIGVSATLAVKEPLVADAVMKAKAARAGLISLRGLYDTVIGPFVVFFREHGWLAALILTMVTLYHLSDYLRGPVTNPYYHDVGLTKPTVAAVRISIGLISSMAGIAAGGLFSLRFGHMRALILGGLLQPLAVLGFCALAWTRTDVTAFSAIMAFDGFSMSFAGVALVAYMSTLTTLGYTATQYALLTSALAVTGKFLKGFSGAWVQQLATGGRDLPHAYALFYAYAAAVGIPAMALVLWLTAVDAGRRRRQAEGSASSSSPLRTS